MTVIAPPAHDTQAWQHIDAIRWLKDGTEIRIVPLLPEHRDRFAAAFNELSEQSKRSRFLESVPELTPGLMHHLVDEVDGYNHLALVALDRKTEVPMGIGRLIRYPTVFSDADLAVTVVDAFRGRGVAQAVAQAVVDYRMPGITHIVTLISASNPAALKVVTHLGPTTFGPIEGGVREVVIALPDDAVPSAS